MEEAEEAEDGAATEEAVEEPFAEAAADADAAFAAAVSADAADPLFPIKAAP